MFSVESHDTAVGPYGIHYQLLKYLPKSALKLLLHVFKDIWESGIVPAFWWEATVIVIPQPGKDHSEANNYRPIAFTRCICKIMATGVRAILLQLPMWLQTRPQHHRPSGLHGYFH